MKRLISVFAAACIAFALAGCSSKKEQAKEMIYKYDKYAVSDVVLNSFDRSKYSDISREFSITDENADGEFFFNTKIKSVIQSGKYSLIRYMAKTDINGGFTPYNYIIAKDGNLSVESGHLGYTESDMPENIVSSVKLLTADKRYSFDAKEEVWSVSESNMSPANIKAYTDGVAFARNIVSCDGDTYYMESIGYDETSALYLFFDENGKLIGEGTQNTNGIYSMNMLSVLLDTAEDRVDQYCKDAIPDDATEAVTQGNESAE